MGIINQTTSNQYLPAGRRVPNVVAYCRIISNELIRRCSRDAIVYNVHIYTPLDGRNQHPVPFGRTRSIDKGNGIVADREGGS